MADGDSTKFEPALRLRIALRDLDPAGDADHFAELVAAFCAMGPPVTLEGAPAMALASKFDLDQRTIRDWASGNAVPSARRRREVTAFLREASVNLGVAESG